MPAFISSQAHVVVGSHSPLSGVAVVVAGVVVGRHSVGVVVVVGGAVVGAGGSVVVVTVGG